MQIKSLLQQGLGTETMGEQLPQRKLYIVPTLFGDEALQIRRKLKEHLTAGAAGPAVVLRVSGDGNADKVIPVEP